MSLSASVRPFCVRLCVCVLTLLLAACVPAETAPSAASDEQTKQIVSQLKRSKELSAFYYEFTMAMFLAKECEAEVKLNEPQAEARAKELEKKYGSIENWDKMVFSFDVDEKDTKAYVGAYVRKRKVYAFDPDAWCRAARREIAEQSRLGKLLAPI